MKNRSLRNRSFGNKWTALTAALIVSAALAFFMFAQNVPPPAAARAKGKGNTAQPGPPHDPHDLAGIWVRRGGVLTMSNEVPQMTPWGQAKFDSYKPSYGPRSIPPALGNDPMGNCDPLGLPRLLVLENNPGDFEFVPARDRMIQLFDRFHVNRNIWTDGRELPKDPEPRWMGYSTAKWEGDIFVITSIGFDERSWLDHFGNPHSDQMRLEERYHRLDRDNMELVMTITDPKTYTKPWVSEKK